MSKILEKATAHFRNKLGGELHKITVPEWECDIYFKGSNTLREEGRIVQLSQEGKSVEALVETLIVKARNADGTKMFGMPDKMIFMNEVDPTVLVRIVTEMNNVSFETMDQVEKN
jgi:hypothetical protein